MSIVLKVAYYFLMSFSIMSSIIFCWHKLLNKKINFKDKKLYITLLYLMLISLINYFSTNEFLRIIVITSLLIVFFSYLFSESLKISLITPIYTQLIYMLSEVIFVVSICVIFGLNSNDIVNTQFGTLLSNIAISMISVIVIQLPVIRKLYNALVKITLKIGQLQLTTLSLIFIILASSLTMILYYKIEFKYLLIFNTLLTLFCFFIVMYTFKTKDNYIKVNEKYNTTLNSLKEYEEMMDRYRILNHENKNQLLTIRNMISKTENKAIEYIDTIVENKLKDNDKIIHEASKIPAGGLRGLIYSKLAYMHEYNIEYELNVSKELKTVDLIDKIDDNIVLDICKIIGVYLDNAIQEVENLKTKFIGIELYLEEEDLIISVTNNYEGYLDLEKLEDKGYTTKNNGHGYGLVLTKELISKNSKLENRKYISEDLFTQELIIKM